MPTPNDEKDEQLEKLKSDPRYGSLRKLIDGAVAEGINNIVAQRKAARKTSKNQATDDDGGNIFDEIFGG